MSKSAPNKFIAPVVIAGITIGFLASAYKFIFQSIPKKQQPSAEPHPATTTSEDDSSTHI